MSAMNSASLRSSRRPEPCPDRHCDSAPDSPQAGAEPGAAEQGTTQRGAVALGIDVGGSAIKAGLVDTDTGQVVDGSLTTRTPASTRPADIAAAVAETARALDWRGELGVTLPAVVSGDIVGSAANIDPSWVGVNARELFTEAVPEAAAVTVLNDADAAGLAEVAFGDERARSGAVIFLTLGTGIGSAMLVDGALFPNSELGHLLVDDSEAEHLAAARWKNEKGWSYEQWVHQLNRVLAEYAKLFSPDLFILGGGISADFAEWEGYLDVNVPVAAARLRNQAGIVGAALAATDTAHS